MGQRLRFIGEQQHNVARQRVLHCFFSASVQPRRALGIAAPYATRRARSPQTPASQRQTEVHLTLSRRATSGGFTPICGKRAASSRRASPARTRALFMGASMPSKTHGMEVGMVTQFVKTRK
jgi:hypothetical protein